MNKINLKGISSESVAGILILLLALVNATLQMFGINALPIENEEVTNIVSTVFLIVRSRSAKRIFRRLASIEPPSFKIRFYHLFITNAQEN